MDRFAEERKQELYGAERNLLGSQLRAKLTESNILRDGEFNINKNSATPGFQWSSVTLDDYKRGILAADQGKQYSEGYKKNIGSYIPIKHEGIPRDTYQQTSMKEAYTDKGTAEKRGYIGNDHVTNWPDMTPQLIKDYKLGHSEYKEIYVPNDTDLARPSYGKISTANVKLPLPYDEKKHKINVSLGADPFPVGVTSEVGHNYLQTYPKMRDAKGLMHMKEQMEWNSNVFKEGDYDGKVGGMETVFDVDYGKRPRASTNTNALDPSMSAEDADRQLNAAIQEQLHFMPQLIESSMQADTARQDGEDGKKYHTHAHFNLGSHADKSMSEYSKDFIPYRSHMKPDRIRPIDAQVMNSNQALPLNTSNRIDYGGTESGANVTLQNRAIRKANMSKYAVRNVNFVNTSDNTKMLSEMNREFRGPPSGYETMKPATEKKCEFDFLASNGAMPNAVRKLDDNTENKDNFQGGAGVRQIMLNSDKARIKSAAKRRLKSGRRAHFTLGTNSLSYKTVSGDTFAGKPLDDEHIPAAGKVEKRAKEFSHLTQSENTEDMLANPQVPTLQESRTALDNYTLRRRDPNQLGTKVTVMKSDFLPMEERAHTLPQIRQMKAEGVKGSKATALTHFFHTDTSCRNNYETTAMASFIKPELMSGKVHLSSLN